MRILFLSAWFPYPPDNGSKIRIYYLLRALGARHKVTLLSFAFDTARPDEAEELQRLCADIHAVAIDPFAANRAGALRAFLALRPVVSRPIAAMSQLVAEEVDSHAYDAIIASTGMMADYALQAPQDAAKILEEHNSMTRWMWERYAGQNNALQRARCWTSWQKLRRYEARSYPEFDLISMVSQADRATTLDVLGDRGVPVEFVSNGVDCNHNRPDLVKTRPFSLVYNGALTYSANYDAMRYFLADIYPMIRQQVSEASLTITGSLSGVDLSGLALDESVHLSGYVEDIRAPVAGAAVCVAPIRQGGGTRLKILEAMALGTPVVATSKAAEGLEVTPGRDILIADVPSEFAFQVVRLLRDSGLCRQLSAHARRLVEERYDWQAIGDQFVALVEEIVAIGQKAENR